MLHERPSHRRPNPHRYWPDPENPGTCRRCHLPDDPRHLRNAVHSGVAAREERVAELAAERAADYIDPSRARHLREELSRPKPD